MSVDDLRLPDYEQPENLRRGIQLDLPEHQKAMGEFVHRVFDGLSKHDPILGPIRGRAIVHAGPTRNVGGETPLDQPMTAIGQLVKVSHDTVREGNVEEFVEVLVDASEAWSEQIRKMLLERLSEVVEASGNLHNASGQPLSPDMIIDMIEKLEMSLDEDGNLNLPDIWTNPTDFAMLEAMEFTSEDTKRLNNVLSTKREQLLERRRTRRLVLED